MIAEKSVGLTPAEKEITLKILRKHLPRSATTWVFGSRTGARVKPFSDLDIAIDAGRKISVAKTAGLAEAFSESGLPWKVDVVAWHAIDAGFARLIQPSLVPLPV